MKEDRATDIHDVKPSSLRHLIGNDHVRQQVQVALDSCFEDQVRFPDTLLCGPPGLGKSTLGECHQQGTRRRTPRDPWAKRSADPPR